VSIFLLLKGFSVGLVFSVTTVAATVWCLQLGLRRGLGMAWTAAAGVAVGQGLWALLAGMTVWMLSRDSPQYVTGVRVFSAMVFVYMAGKSARTPALRELPPLETPAVGPARLAVATLAVMLSMPMRFFGHVGLFLAAGVAWPPLDGPGVGMLVAGVVAGTLLWFGLVGALATGLREKMPPEFWVQVVHRQTRLAVLVYAGLAVIVLVPAVLWWMRR
jgi:threonine/homoserine/homoserine lactone efflux protein